MHLISIFQLKFNNDPTQYITNNIHDLITFINNYFKTNNINKVYGLNTIYKYIQRKTYKKYNIETITSSPISFFFEIIYLNKYKTDINKCHRLTAMKRLNKLYEEFITNTTTYKEIPKITNEQTDKIPIDETKEDKGNIQAIKPQLITT